MILTGERVALRAMTAADVDRVAAIMAEPAVARWWPGFDRARVEDDLLLGQEEGDRVYVVVVGGEVVGVVQSYEEPDPEYRKASIDIAVATAWHGTGVAADAIRTLARHLIDDRGHHHLTIDPAAANARAVRCYARLGFRPVGVLRRNERGADGTFHDTLLMDLLAGELR